MLDFSKAFDYFDHDFLQQNLKSPTFSKSTIEIISFFIRIQQQKTIDNINKTNLISMHQGIPVGTCLEPLIFNLSISDLNKQLPYSCKVSQCEDETLFLYKTLIADQAKKKPELNC